MKCVLIGYGYWGKILLGYIHSSVYFELAGICDPGLKDSLFLENVWKKNLAECAFVCVPVGMHYEMVSTLLDHGIHVFCEKPLCRNLAETRKLYEKAGRVKRTLFTDYIYTVSPSIRFIKKHRDALGAVRYANLVIKQFGNFYKDDDVYEVIGVHMISAFLYIMDRQGQDIQVEKVLTIQRNERGYAEAGIIFFHMDELSGKIECSLTSAEKERKIELVCENGIIVFDMLREDTVQIIFHQKEGYQKKQRVLEKRAYDEKNNLSLILEEFYRTVQTGDSSNERISLRTAKVLERVQNLEKSV